MPQTAAYDHIIVYGDREHFSNIHYFTGYDPRWEESLLILERGKTPILLVGNEGLSYTHSLCAEVDARITSVFSRSGSACSAYKPLSVTRWFTLSRLAMR